MVSYFRTLLLADRFEEAKSLLREWHADAGDDIPAAVERSFNYRFGMIAMLEKDYESAYLRFSSAINSEQDTAYDETDAMILTMTALAADRTGRHEAYGELIVEAERNNHRARLNGVNSPDILYAEATILALKNEPAPALQKLQGAYDQGFREWWLFKVDGRLDSLRQNPDFIAINGMIQRDIAQALSEVRTAQLGAG